MPHFGWRPSAPDHRDYLYAPPQAVLLDLPASVDLDTPSVGEPYDPLYDQGALGSCGPNAAAANVAYDEARESHGGSRPSRLFVYYATRQIMGTTDYDSGVDNRSLLKSLVQYGWCDETSWPYDISRFTVKPPAVCWTQAAARKIGSYLSVAQSLTQLKGCLAEGFPWIMGFTVYSSFMSAAVEATGIVPMPGTSEEVQGGHDILIVGYDDQTQRFKFRNSWGLGWGIQGHGWMPYSYALSSKLSGDFWTIRGSGVTPAPPTPSPTPTTMRLTIPPGTVPGDYELTLKPVRGRRSR